MPKFSPKQLVTWSEGQLRMQVPIMLRSDYCSLHDQDDMQLQDLGECPYDQVCRTTLMLHVMKRCMQA